MKKQFFKYVFQNVAGMIGISVYILADTFFIAQSGGANGITVLNLALPIYGLVFAIGSMIGIGSATRYAIGKAAGKERLDDLFTHALFWQLLLSVPFMLTGLFAPEKLLAVMGADTFIQELGRGYVQIVFPAAPIFMMNYTFSAFVRNDEAPTTAMLASLGGSIFNIIFDYVFIFPMHMGISGAALATAMAPGVSILINSSHFFGKNCSLKIRWRRPSIRRLLSGCQLGVSAFVGEMSSAITMTVFNFLLLGIAGNTGVAAYGVVANYSLIAMAVFNGISQGTQPLLSQAYGQKKELASLLRWGVLTSLVVECLTVFVVWKWTDFLVAMFNSEGNQLLASYAYDGMRLYFPGYLAAGINLIFITFFSATNRAKEAFIASILRGAVAITLCAVLMSMLLGMNGIWLSFLVAEGITLLVVVKMLKKSEKKLLKL